VELVIGADGSNDGDIHGTNPLPIVSKSGSSAVTSVNAATSTTSILSANSNRKGALFYNDSSFALYLKFGATASTSSFTTKIEGGQLFSAPLPIWTGAIDGLWDGAVGAVRVTELT
jgi:hypothetical protein